jgi:YD repeat-containing protein
VRNFVAIQWGDGGEAHYEQLNAGTFVTPAGHRNTLTRSAPGKYILRTWNNYVYYFDSARHRRITRIEDPNGLALVFTYNEAGLLTRIGDSYGRRLELAYALDGDTHYLVQVTDPNVTPARVVRYGHDAAGNLTSVADPLGNTTVYRYDNAHDLTGITDPQGNRLDIAYDADGRAISLLTPLSALYFSYGTTQTTALEIVEGQARRVIYAYDGLGRVIQASDGAGRAVGYAWDDNDNLVRLTNPNGGSTTLAYDSRGNLIAVTDPLGQTERYGYVVGVSQPVSFTDKLGNTTRYEYDARFGSPPTVRLVGCDGPGHSYAPGSDLALTLYWQALAEMDISYTVFVQVLTPDWRVVAQVDRQPLDGTAPTNTWLVGEYLTDTYRLALPADLAPGVYRLIVGLYDAQTGQRLPVSSGGDFVTVSTLDIAG